MSMTLLSSSGVNYVTGKLFYLLMLLLRFSICCSLLFFAVGIILSIGKKGLISLLYTLFMLVTNIAGSRKFKLGLCLRFYLSWFTTFN